MTDMTASAKPPSKVRKSKELLGLSCRIPRLRRRLGRCYELSYLGLLADAEWTLVHGSLRGPESQGGWVGHAWLHRKSDQMIFDPAQDLLLSRFDFQLKHRQKTHCEYSRMQAMLFATHFGHYGPWHSLVSESEFERLMEGFRKEEASLIASMATPKTELELYGTLGKEGFLRALGA